MPDSNVFTAQEAKLKFDGKTIKISLPDGTNVVISDERIYSVHTGLMEGNYNIAVKRDDFVVNVGSEFLTFDSNKKPTAHKSFSLKN